VYVLTGEADEYFPNNFALLARNLVRQVKNVLPQEQIDTLFRSLAFDLAKEFGEEEIDPTQCTREHLRRVAEFLNEQGYLASFEEESDGQPGVFLLHKHNCPYAGVSGEHSELCLMDQTLVDTLIGGSCQRVAHMVNEGHCCTYRIEVQDFEHSAGEVIALAPALMRGTPNSLSARSAIALVA
jgi:predicted ArsR family transcriptional regulator